MPELQNMSKPNVRRRRGYHDLPGDTKRQILIFVFNHPNGVQETDIREYLRKNCNIIEKKSIIDHLNDLLTVFYLKKTSEGKGKSNIWIPTNDIDIFKRLWNDYKNHIWENATLSEVKKFLSTKQVKNIIETNIVPAFINFPVSKTFKGNKLYTDLPSRINSESELKELEKLCTWACISCPTLITHLFKPKREVLLCITMVLSKFLDLPAIWEVSIIPEPRPVQDIRSYQEMAIILGDIIRILPENWQDIRFKQDLSKETICALTMLTCFFMYFEKDQEAEEELASNIHFTQLWEFFIKKMNEIHPQDTAAIPDALKIMFSMLFAQSYYENSRSSRHPPQTLAGF